jgi:protein-arginine deiminase
MRLHDETDRRGPALARTRNLLFSLNAPLCLIAALALPACGDEGGGGDSGEAGTSDATGLTAGEAGSGDASGSTGTDSATTDSGTTDPTTDSGTTDPTTDSGTTDPTTDSGTTDPTTDSGTTGDDSSNPDWEFDDIYGVPNTDDDDNNNQADWYQSLDANSDDDLEPFIIGSAAIDQFDAGDQIRLTLSGDTDRISIWHNGSVVLGSGASGSSYTFTPGGGTETFHTEWQDHLDDGDLLLERLDSANNVIDNDTVRVLASPMILHHHLQTAETAMALNAGNSNAPLISAYQTNFSDFIGANGQSYGWDVWMQDEIQFAYSTSPNGARLDTVIDSIRDRGLDPFPENQLEGPDIVVRTWGSGHADTRDSFGNLEVSPPVTVNGTEYPFGRIYYGQGMHSSMVAQLENQQVQDPFSLNTSWLCVKHIDELTSFVPDPSSAKGFKFLFADTTAGYEVLDAMSNVSLPLFQADYNYSNVAAMQNDSALRAENQDIQSDYLDPMLDTFKAELGLTDADIILIPTIFEQYGNCGDVALIPGTVNLIVGNEAGESTKLFIPDPMMRTNTSGGIMDPFSTDFANRMPDGLELLFTDNWDAYHVALGEIHCGTNIIRTPWANWWEVAMHLL